jgi:hypothetical protein
LKQERPNKIAAQSGHTEIPSGRFTQKAEKRAEKYFSKIIFRTRMYKKMITQFNSILTLMLKYNRELSN